MQISGRTIAYLIILLAAFLVGGITFAGAQEFPPVNPLPVPVEESGIVEIFEESSTVSPLRASEFCDFEVFEITQVPAGKRLIIEHVTAAVYSESSRRALRGEPAKIYLSILRDSGRFQHLIALSPGFPISGGGPITMYADAEEYVDLIVTCPGGIGVDDDLSFHYGVTGRLVPHPHPSMIPTATPPP